MIEYLSYLSLGKKRKQPIIIEVLEYYGSIKQAI